MYMYITAFVSLRLCLPINDFGLIGWIGLTVLSQNYFIKFAAGLVILYYVM